MLSMLDHPGQVCNPLCRSGLSHTGPLGASLTGKHQTAAVKKGPGPAASPAGPALTALFPAQLPQKNSAAGRHDAGQADLVMQALPTDGHTGVVGGVAPAEAVRGLLVEHRVHLPHAGGQIGVPHLPGGRSWQW